MPIRPGMTAPDVNAAIVGTFPALLGITYLEVGPGHAVATLDVHMRIETEHFVAQFLVEAAHDTDDNDHDGDAEHHTHD